MKTLLVTGGAGFIGSNFIRYILKTYKHYKIINIDKLTYAGNLDNIKDIQENQSKRHIFIQGDICDEILIRSIVTKVDFIINFAAETHVDRSIQSNQEEFVKTDILGTVVLLNSVRKSGHIQKYIQISTDEVYGDIKKGKFADENSILNPSNPYSASKAGGDLQVLSFIKTYKIPAVISRCSNNYGPYMHPEKFIPLAITNVLEGKKIQVYGDGQQTRNWLNVNDHCRAIDIILHEGKNGQIYTIGASHRHQITNLKIAQTISKILKSDNSLIEWRPDRLGHDKRYALTCDKLKKLGWQAEISFESGLKDTIKWYQNNRWWWEKIKNSKEFMEYYSKQYT